MLICTRVDGQITPIRVVLTTSYVVQLFMQGHVLSEPHAMLIPYLSSVQSFMQKFTRQPHASLEECGNVMIGR